LPLLSCLSVIFWLALIAYITSSRIRLWTHAHLTMPAPSNQAHLPVVDAIRGLSALFVAVFHTWQWSRPAFDPAADIFPVLTRGHYAVPIFVFFSAFLITRAIQRITKVEDLKRYAARRLFRVYPLYLAIVAAIVLLGYFPLSTEYFTQRLFAEISMVRIFGFQAWINPVAWSLYVEVAFYAVAPLIVIGAGKRLVPIMLVLVLVFFLTEKFAIGAMQREYALWRFLFLGIVTAEFSRRVQSPAPPLGLSFILGGLLLLVIEVGFGVDIVEHVFRRLPGGAASVPSLFPLGIGIGLLLLTLGLLHAPRIAQAGGPLPLRMLGGISYSLFLWHPILICLDLPIRFDSAGGVGPVGPMPTISPWSMPFVFIPAFLAVSILSFVAIERPFLRLYRERRREDADGVVASEVRAP
jgi:peptidoglycan/LPS O-acetylase OafA/YrhL